MAALPEAAARGGAGAGATERRAGLERIDRLARLLDSRLRLPVVGWRVGLDGLIGLIPGVGDAIGFTAAAYIVAEAYRLGARPSVLARMIANIAVDLVLGAVPLAGDLFDFAWKANLRNAALARQELGGRIMEGRRG